MSSSTIPFDRFMGESLEIAGVGIHANIELPAYVPAENMYIDLGRLARICRIARIGDLTLSQFSQSEEKIQPTIGSIDETGTATSTATVTAAKTKRHQLSSDKNSSTSKVTAEIKINTAHPDLDQVNLRDPQPWSHLVDSGIRSGLRDSGNNHFFVSRNWFDKAYGAWILTNWSIPLYNSLSNNVLSASIIQSNLAEQAGTVGIVNLLLAGLMTGRNGRFDAEWSAVPLLPVDRAAAVQALTRTQKLVTAKKHS